MDDKRQQLIALLREVVGIVAAQYRKCAGDPKLTMPQLIVLNLLALNGPMRISELAEQAYCSNSTVSGIVDRLEKLELARRDRSGEDRRVIYVAATENYQALRKKAETDVGGYFSSVLCSMPKEDRLLIASALHKLDEALLSKEAEDAGL